MNKEELNKVSGGRSAHKPVTTYGSYGIRPRHVTIVTTKEKDTFETKEVPSINLNANTTGNVGFHELDDVIK